MKTEGGEPSPVDRSADPLLDYARLERSLRDLTDSNVLGGAEGHYAEAQQAAQSLFHNPAVCGNRALETPLAATLDHIESEARELFDVATEEAEGTGARLIHLRFCSRLLRRLTRVVSGRTLRDETPFLLAEIQNLESTLPGAEDQEEETAVTKDDLQDRGTRLRLQVMNGAVERKLREARRIQQVTLASAPAAYRVACRLRVTRHKIDTQKRSASDETIAQIDPVLGELDSERRRLEHLAFSQIEAGAPQETLRALVEMARPLIRELDEARIASFETREVAELEFLSQLADEGHRLRLTLKAWRKKAAGDKTGDDQSDLATEARRVHRRLRRHTRRVRNLVSDRTLARRLDRLFGPRMVRWWESFVFWLIMAVLGLLIVDHYRTPDPEEVIGWTIWADTGICAVLLLDFLVRWMLSPRRWRYLQRHFFTELLPSIPFGLISKLEHVALLRSVRVLRLARVFRVLRILRPLLRIGRLFLFLARATDRLVEKNAWILNRNIVFFTDPTREEGEPVLLKRERDLDRWIQRTTGRLLAELPAPKRVEAAQWRLALLETEIREDSRNDSPLRAPSRRSRRSELNVDDAIRFLRSLDADKVAELVGIEFADELCASLRFIRLPLLRRLPVSRFLVGSSGNLDPLMTTARLGHVLGDLLAFAQRSIQWFADLHGTITGAQFLDRLGQQIIVATARPAKRLLLFGAILGLALLFVEAAQLPFFEDVAGVLRKFLSTPVLILGGICLIPLLLGFWFRKIAGKAVDFYHRVAEAQFLSLTETVKEARRDQELRTLSERVLFPEARLTDSLSEEREEEFCAQIASHAEQTGGMGHHVSAPPTDQAELPVDWTHCDFMLLFYRDFLDGAYFHRNDTKIANFLVGNLTLENIRRNRLRFSKKRMKRLQRVNLENRPSLRGPQLWFRFITHSVAYKTARLVLEYNHYCIPRNELDTADEEDRQLFESWLERRQRLSDARQRGIVLPHQESDELEATRGTLVYRTTEFHALHFLSAETTRDEAVSRRYGDVVLNLLREDRQNLIRDIFGTYPMHELPRENRTFNPYDWYRKFCYGGRVFLLPIVAFGYFFKGVRTLIRRVTRIIKDVIDPHSRPTAISSGHAGFDVAIRKIHRMRRPTVMEAVRLRTAFDLEYCGLSLPGLDATVVKGGLVDDLRKLNASEREWEEFRNHKSTHERRLRILSRVVRSVAGSEETLASYLTKEHLLSAESVRAATTAFLCDHEGLYSLAEAYDELSALLRELPETKKRRRLRFSRKKLAGLLDRCWPVLSEAAEEEDLEDCKQRLTDALSDSGKDRRRQLKVLAEHVEEHGSPYASVMKRLVSVAATPSAWTEQIIAVRTVQSLAMLDLEGYESLIAQLGNYSPVSREATESSPQKRL